MKMKMPDKIRVKEFIKKYKDIVRETGNADSEDCANKLGHNNGVRTFKILFQLPQPAHLIVLMTVLYLGFVLFPKDHPTKTYEPGTFSNLVYIGSFATHFGAQMWMTFVSGIVLFFTIPRNHFSQVQRILFPKYFLMNTILGLLTLTTFVQHHPDTWSLQQKIQVWALSVCCLIELATRLYIVPPLLQLMAIRTLIEDEAGIGNEIGRHDPGKLKDCPHYNQIHRQFRKMHGFCAAANVTAVACNGIHLYHLATCITTAAL